MVVVALVIVVVLAAAGVFDDGSSPSPTTGASGGSSPSANPTQRSPVVGTIDDSQAGVSYAQLGGKWKLQEIPPTSGFARNYGFTKGEVAVVQESYNGKNPYLASAYSGRLPASVTYKGTGDLESAATSFGRTIESEPEPNGSYPSHSRQDLESKSQTIDGRSAWYSKFRLTFPQAQAQGWNFRTETVIFILIDQGSGKRPSVVWLTLPDSHENGGDLELLAGSVKVS